MELSINRFRVEGAVQNEQESSYGDKIREKI